MTSLLARIKERLSDKRVTGNIIDGNYDAKEKKVCYWILSNDPDLRARAIQYGLMLRPYFWSNEVYKFGDQVSYHYEEYDLSGMPECRALNVERV